MEENYNRYLIDHGGISINPNEKAFFRRRVQSLDQLSKFYPPLKFANDFDRELSWLDSMSIVSTTLRELSSIKSDINSTYFLDHKIDSIRRMD